MDLRKAYQGMQEATPDGKLPKINAPHMDGIYDLEVDFTENFVSFETGNGTSFKAECTVLSCDNGKFKPGTKVAVVIHGITDPTPFKKELAFGNQKALMAAAATSKYDEELNAYDQGFDWIELACQCGVPESKALAGARIRAQVVTDVAKKSGKPFGRTTYSPLSLKAAA